jgi:hypothetical protein
MWRSGSCLHRAGLARPRAISDSQYKETKNISLAIADPHETIKGMREPVGTGPRLR